MDKLARRKKLVETTGANRISLIPGLDSSDDLSGAGHARTD